MPELHGMRAAVQFLRHSTEPCAAPPTRPFMAVLRGGLGLSRHKLASRAWKKKPTLKQIPPLCKEAPNSTAVAKRTGRLWALQRYESCPLLFLWRTGHVDTVCHETRKGGTRRKRHLRGKLSHILLHTVRHDKPPWSAPNEIWIGALLSNWRNR